MTRNRIVFWVLVLFSPLHSTGIVFAQTPGPGCSWGDDFDGYALGSDPGGQGEWIGGGAVVTDFIASSPPHSVVFDEFDNVIRPFDDLTSGPVVVRAQVYVPSNMTGDLYFIMLNRFQVGGPCRGLSAVRRQFEVFSHVEQGVSGCGSDELPESGSRGTVGIIGQVINAGNRPHVRPVS